jgi:ketosteroid isomerase-like protein
MPAAPGDALPTTDTEIVGRVITAMGVLDVDEVRRWVADDLVLELPFRAGGFPTTLVGEDAHAFMRLVDKLFERMDFYDIVVHGATPSGVIAAEYKSNGLTKTGKPYPNVYAAFLEVRDGKVIRWREYFNPDVVTAAMS